MGTNIYPFYFNQLITKILLKINWFQHSKCIITAQRQSDGTYGNNTWLSILWKSKSSLLINKCQKYNCNLQYQSSTIRKSNTDYTVDNFIISK